MKKRVAVLGATGSIGRSALDVLRNKSDSYEPVLFSANKNSGELLLLKKEFPGAITALSCDLPGFDYRGKEGLLKAIAAAKADITVNGISGAAGLPPSEAVIRSGSDLALANKETLVMAGRLILDLARGKNVRVIPVDSEHSAIYKLLEAHGREKVSEIILTASGGPFRNCSVEQLSRVTPQEALAHPTWKMGPKISVDSATLANKGLEVMEAALYFDFPPEKIKVTIHPQSIVHSMVRLKNGAVYSQMSEPDMRLVIHDALSWPDTELSPFGKLDLDSLQLSFEKPDPGRFPMLALAYDALKGGPHLTVAYNAANEEAVRFFIDGKIGFLEIPRIVGYVISRSGQEAADTIGDVIELDGKARRLALEYLENGSNRSK
jgi:1-deoxy-D-xylulose-5-phosphate reductoisomerase